ncbi:hypothetical protein M0804_008083 [Polistes exclamans]|nr:hypothetical protein M0804_008083 [Polistes exclamans]
MADNTSPFETTLSPTTTQPSPPPPPTPTLLLSASHRTLLSRKRDLLMNVNTGLIDAVKSHKSELFHPEGVASKDTNKTV